MWSMCVIAEQTVVRRRSGKAPEKTFAVCCFTDTEKMLLRMTVRGVLPLSIFLKQYRTLQLFKDNFYQSGPPMKI